MKSNRYFMAHDCPNCGDKDELNKWGGARIYSTAWGHKFSCCSDECGIAFGKIAAQKEKTAEGRKWLSDLWVKFEVQSDTRLCGEPYLGYDAEKLLKSLGR